MTPELLDSFKVLDMKERLLNEIIVWLKAKGLFEEAMKDCPSGKGLSK